LSGSFVGVLTHLFADAALRRILGPKDEVQYGARSRTTDEALKMLAKVGEFAAWGWFGQPD
jgi:hypothetical protein